MVDFDPIFLQWSKKKMMKFCKQYCELARFIETKEYSGIIEYDKESQHLKYLYKNQKKKYKKYKQALKMTKANGLMGLDFWSSTWLVDNILSTYIGYPLKKVLKPLIKSCSCVNFGIKPTKISFFILYVCILFVVREKN